MSKVTTRGSAAAVSHTSGFSPQPSQNHLLRRPSGTLYDEQLKRAVALGYNTFWKKRGVVHPNPQRVSSFVEFNKSVL